MEKNENTQKQFSISSPAFEPPCEDHLVLAVTITFESSVIQTHAMIDCGASSSFIDSKFASSVSIPLIQKSEPVDLRVIDGESISSGPVQFHTVPLNLFIASFQKNHKEKISFN